MQIQVNTGSQTSGPAEVMSNAEALIEDKLGRFASRITRVEVHMTDANSASKTGGDDKRCQLEVRMAGMQPISVTDHAGARDQALNGAVEKMISLIETTLGKQERR